MEGTEKVGIGEEEQVKEITIKKENNKKIDGKFINYKTVLKYLNYIVLPVIIVFLWNYVTTNEIFSAAILPSISTVFASFKAQLISGQLVDDTTTSLKRVVEGYSISVVLGILSGVIMGMSSKVDRFFFFVFSSIRQIPMLAWVPLIVLWFGIGELSKIIVIILASFFPILLNTVSGIKRTDKGLIEVGNMYNLSKWKKFTKIYFPSALPSIFVGLKLGLGISWMAVVGAEIIAASSGIGYRMNDARSLMQPEVVFVGMIVIALIGLIMDFILTKVSKKITPWENGK